MRARPELPVAVAVLLLLMLTSGGYGRHRDELYFLAAGQHPAWGYPDQPLFTPLVVAGLGRLGGGSLPVVRLAAALAAATGVLLVGGITAEMSGSRRAQLIAAACWGVGGLALVSGHTAGTTCACPR